MEEIDIIELLKRVKEGKAPKEIEIDGYTCEYNPDGNTIDTLYVSEDGMWFEDLSVDFYTKIKILDKPIIPELPQINQNEYDTNSSYRSLVAYENRYKINEIIRYLNKEEK